ncbi:hypothetical protein TorRG33x02_341570 [Trema orientale]|uniref:Uncharacterized protein n=1 Tax=Trema orientale TaxID=63057 RepID=A0A2P5ATQ7_TREOI|nr:hypothetical protein TorRG33x02_341570 [Trema orientale]
MTGASGFKSAPMTPIHTTTIATVTVDTNSKTNSGNFFSDNNWRTGAKEVEDGRFGTKSGRVKVEVEVRS